MQGTPSCRTQQFALNRLAVHTSARRLCLDKTIASASPSADAAPSARPGINPGAVHRSSTVCFPAGNSRERNALSQVPCSARVPSCFLLYGF